MTSDNTGSAVFAQQTQQQASPDLGPKTVETDVAYADQLAAITNDQGVAKYTSVNDALNALKATQEHIKTLESENLGFRNNASSGATRDEILNALKPSQPNVDGQTSQPQMDAMAIKDTTMDVIRQYEAQKVAQSNQNSVNKELTERYGDKALDVYSNKALELGLQMQDMDSLAATAPAAVLAYFATSKGNVFKQSAPGSVNTEAFNTHQSQNQPAKFDNLMIGAKTEDLVSAWKQVKEQVNQTLNIN